MTQYKMLRVREEDYDKLREAQRLLQKKGLESVDWKTINDQNWIQPPPIEGDDAAAAIALTLGFVIGVGAAAVAALVAKGLADAAETGRDDDD
jgi:hypothetical protein